MEKKKVRHDGRRQSTRWGFSGIKHTLKMRFRRLFSVLLCVSLVTGSMPISALTAFAADDDSDEADYVYEIDRISFAEAVQKAVDDGDYLEKEIKFLGEASETYYGLFEDDGSLYELSPDSLGMEKDKDREKDLNLRVFTRITKDIPLDEVYEIDGEEDILFLLQNKTDKEVSVSIYVDGRESEMIRIPAAGDMEVSFDSDSDKDDESDDDLDDDDIYSGDIDKDSTHADVEESRGFSGGKSSGNASSGGRGSNAASKGDKDDAAGEDKDSSVKDNKDSDKAGNDPGNRTSKDIDKEAGNKAEPDKEKDNNSAGGDRNEGSGKKNDKSGDSKSDSGKENGNKNTAGKESNSKNSDSKNLDSNNTNGKDSNNKNSGSNDSGRSDSTSDSRNGSKGGDKGNSDSGSKSSNDKEKTDKQSKGDKSASISVHSGNLLTAAIASDSDADKASPSDASKMIDGTVYDPVRIGRHGAVAFVTTTANLGLTEVSLAGIISDSEIYSMYLDALCDAVEYEVNEGEPLKEDDESYLYEISPELEEEAEGLTLRTFVKINKTAIVNEDAEIADSEDEGYADPAYSEEESVDIEYSTDEEIYDFYVLEDLSNSTVYYVTGDEEIYFLLTNETDEAIIARILVASSDDIYETERLIVPGNGVTEVSDFEDDEDYGIMYLESTYEETTDITYEEEDSEDTYIYDDGSAIETDADDECTYDDRCIAMEGTVYEDVSDEGESEIVYVTTLGNLGVNYGIKLLAGDTAQVTEDGTVTGSYASLGDAITAANASTGEEVTVTLLEDVTETVAESNHFTISRGMTIDLNGHTIYVIGTNTNYRLFYIDDLDQVDITFTNGTVDGKADGEEAAVCYFIYDYRASKKQHNLVIDKLTVQNFGACTFGTIYLQSSDFTATKSTFKDNDTRAFCIQNYPSMSSGYREYCNVVVTGCTIDNNNFVTSRTSDTSAVTPNNTSGYAGYAAMGGGFFINWVNSAKISGNTIKNNSAQLNGGGFMVCGSYDTEIEGNVITGNKTTLDTVPWASSINNYNPYTAGGGGFTIYRPQKDVTIKENTITDNSTYGFGGGFFITHNNYDSHVLGDILIEDNAVSENFVAPFDWNNMAHGGGIAVYNVNGVHESDDNTITFKGNKITDNKAGADDAQSSTSSRGGGVSLVDESTAEFIIDSGEISGNIADIGGGIDLTLPYNEADRDEVGGTAVLKLYNVEVTDNTAVRGGGLWTNPSSKTEMYTENLNHGVIYGNTASGSFTYGDGKSYEASGDDICYEAEDSDLEKDGELTGSDGEVKSDSKLKVVNVDLEGNEYDWYTDEAGARYPAGEKVTDYTFRDTVNLHADIQNPAGDYELLITGNTARAYGGGIASDAIIYFGDDSEIHENEVDVIVTTSGDVSSTTTYNTLAEAVDAANEVDDADADVTLKLNRDIVVNLNLDEDASGIEPDKAYATVTRGITLDLDKNTIDIKNGEADNYMLEIETADTVTITNGTINGSPTGAEATSAYIVHSKGSTGACNNLVLDNLSIIDFNEAVYGTIYTEYCDLTVTDCTFKANNTRGFYFTGGTENSHEAVLKVENSTFDTNTATEGSTTFNTFGGAFYAEYAETVIINGNTIYNNGDHGRSQDFMYLEGGGGFYLYNCGDNNKAKPSSTGEFDNITITNNTVTNNTAIGKTFEHNIDNIKFWKTGGGGFNLYNTAGEIKIENNTVDSNRAYSFGGGISILNEDQTDNGYLGNVDIFDNVITNNILYDTYHMNAYNVLEQRCEGGGIAVTDMESSHGGENVEVNFIGNSINENTCGTNHSGISNAESKFNRGGGMSLYSYDTDGITFNLLSGEVCDNVANAGGGINYTDKNAFNVKLYNAIITENTSFRGGGVWLCPTSETIFYQTFGGAIYGNTATGDLRINANEYWFTNGAEPCGDDIRYEGVDSDIVEFLFNDQAEYEEWLQSDRKTVCTLTSRALGGGLYNWYTDGMYADYSPDGRVFWGNPYSGTELIRYKDATDAQKEDLYVPAETIRKVATVASDGRNDGYKERTGSFSLHSELSEKDIEQAQEEATFIISGNTAYFVGGGIGSNCQFDFGIGVEDESVKIKKTFIDENGEPIGEDENGNPVRIDELPESVSVTLVREAYDSHGNHVVGFDQTLETVELNADNDWSYTFDDLDKYLIIVGDSSDPDSVYAYEWHYGIEEVDVKMPDADEDYYWGLLNDKITAEEDEDGVLSIRMVNKRYLAPAFTKEEFEDDYERKNEDEVHDDENGHYEENVEGDGWGTWDDADNNQEIRYHMKVDHIKDTESVVIHDYLEQGLDFESGTVKITLYNGLDDATGKVLEEGADKDYVVNEGDCSDPECKLDGCTFEVRFAQYIFEPEFDPINPGEPLDEEAWILLEYNALTDTHADDYFEGDHEYQDVILNDAYLECDLPLAVNALSFRSIIVETETELFGFGVFKYYEDEEGRYPLGGAEFVLSETGLLTDGSTGTRYATFETESDHDGKNYYLTSGWVDNIEDATRMVSGSDGYVRIEGLDDDVYYLTEVKAPAGYEILDDSIEVDISEFDEVEIDGENGKETVVSHEIPVSNVPTEFEISGTKIWDDNDDQDGRRPESITVHLYATTEDETREVASVTVTEADGWSWSFTDLPTHVNGVEIVYTFVEEEVEDYTTEYSYDSDTYEYTITNHYTPGKTGRSVEKIWVDNYDSYGRRPVSITVDLIRKNGTDETVIDSATLSKDNDWYANFTGLDEYTDGVKNEYSVIERDVPYGYDTEVVQLVNTTLFVMTNTFSPDKLIGTGNLTIHKEVTGSGSSTTDDFSFTLELTGGIADESYEVINENKEHVGWITFDENGNASYEFTLKHGESITVKDLPEGIVYTITETDSNGYTVNITGVTEAEGSSASGEISADGVEVTFTNSRGTTTTTNNHHSSGGGGGGGSSSGGSGSTTGGPGGGSGSSGETGGDSYYPTEPMPQTGDPGTPGSLLMMILGIGALLVIAILDRKKKEITD